MSNGTPAICMDASNTVVEIKEVCYNCNAVITLVYPGNTGWLSTHVAPNSSVSVKGYGPFEMAVTNGTNGPQNVHVTISQPDVNLRPVSGGLILRLGFNSKLETAVFCSWKCACEGVQAWVQGLAAALVKKALAG